MGGFEAEIAPGVGEILLSRSAGLNSAGCRHRESTSGAPPGQGARVYVDSCRCAPANGMDLPIKGVPGAVCGGRA